MRYVVLDMQGDDGMMGALFSPGPYLEHLPKLIEDLPTGAGTFADDPDHYDFYSKRCTKDLKLQQFSMPSDSCPDVEVLFRHNCWKHDEDLIIRYVAVSDIRIEIPHREALGSPGTVLLDEILPHQDGCSHEIAFRPGSLHIVCRDLIATWVPTDCPDALDVN